MTIAMLTGLIFLAATAFAQQPAPPETAAPAEPPSIQAYGDRDATCIRWADSCRACSRGPDGEPRCSNIGIACQPKKVECTARKEETPK